MTAQDIQKEIVVLSKKRDTARDERSKHDKIARDSEKRIRDLERDLIQALTAK